MIIESLCKNYNVRKLNEEDIPEIYKLCSKNELYYRYCPPFVTEDSICEDMSALPPGKDENDKYYIGVYDDRKLIAILDLISGFPDEETAYIGFFMVDADKQKQGIGTNIITGVNEALKNENYKGIELAWVQGNPQAEAFWHKNGFVETGNVCDMGEYSVVVARREL